MSIVISLFIHSFFHLFVHLIENPPPVQKSKTSIIRMDQFLFLKNERLHMYGEKGAEGAVSTTILFA